MTTYRTTYHRDGTVTYWDVWIQGWRRRLAKDIGSITLATLSPDERRRIGRMADRQEAVLE